MGGLSLRAMASALCGAFAAAALRSNAVAAADAGADLDSSSSTSTSSGNDYVKCVVGGNVGGDKAERGNLTQLKVAGLITTDIEEGNTWLFFTDAGKALAAQHGITI
jgi:hypothetical protein